MDNKSNDVTNNIFDQFQTFLGHFWGADRTGMFQNPQDLPSLLKNTFGDQG